MGKQEEEGGRRWVICMYGERGRLPPALGKGDNRDSRGGGEGTRRDADHTGRGPGNARGDSETWGGKECGIAGLGRKVARTGESYMESRTSRTGMARAGCERERGATRDGRAGAT